MTPKILSRSVKYFDQYEGSGLTTYRVRSKYHPTSMVLDRLGLRPMSCNHLHDCCGCFQAEEARVEKRIKRNEWLVTRHWYRNV